MTIKDPEKRKRVNEMGAQELSEYGTFSETCRRIAESRHANSPIRQEMLVEYMNRVEEYVEDCRRVGKPLTHAGFALACDIGIDTWRRIREGQFDYVPEEFRILHNLPADAEEYITEDGEIIPLIPWSEVFKKCELLIQDQLESNCYTNKGNPAGSIFGLKARFDWRDDPEVPNHLTQNLVIADSNQARKALQMLTRTPEE